MTPTEIAVIVGSLLGIIFILYYFFGPKNDVEAGEMTRGKQTATVVVYGAFIPSEITLKSGLPAEITFDRRDSAECTDWVIFDQFPHETNKEVKSYLPQGKKTLIKFTPLKAGTYGFACGMGMNHGKLIIES